MPQAQKTTKEKKRAHQAGPGKPAFEEPVSCDDHAKLLANYGQCGGSSRPTP